MTLLFQYLLRQHLRVLGLCLGGLACIYLVLEFVDKIRKFVGHGPELRHVMWYFVLKLPSILFQIAPLAVLMASVLTMAILARHNEITAMRSHGVSLYRVTLPFLIVAQIVSVIMLWANDAVIPRANQRAELVRERQIERQSPRAIFQGNEIWVRLGNQTIMRGDLADESALKLYGISLYRLATDFRVLEVLHAKELVHEHGQWILHSGVSRTFEDDDRAISHPFERLAININQKPEDFRRMIRVLEQRGIVAQSSEALSLRDLSAYVERLREDGYNPAPYATDLFGRTAFPFVCVIMAIIGSSMSLMDMGARGVGVVRGVGYTLIIAFLYWATHSVALAFGRSGVVPPLLAGWSANLVFLSFAGYLFLRIRQ
jgi:lipopolysaccharide export system permease protein